MEPMCVWNETPQETGASSLCALSKERTEEGKKEWLRNLYQ